MPGSNDTTPRWNVTLEPLPRMRVTFYNVASDPDSKKGRSELVLTGTKINQIGRVVKVGGVMMVRHGERWWQTKWVNTPFADRTLMPDDSKMKFDSFKVEVVQ